MNHTSLDKWPYLSAPWCPHESDGGGEGVSGMGMHNECKIVTLSKNVVGIEWNKGHTQKWNTEPLTFGQNGFSLTRPAKGLPYLCFTKPNNGISGCKLVLDYSNLVNESLSLSLSTNSKFSYILIK